MEKKRLSKRKARFFAARAHGGAPLWSLHARRHAGLRRAWRARTVPAVCRWRGDVAPARCTVWVEEWLFLGKEKWLRKMIGKSKMHLVFSRSKESA
jgi:hypothetical protein